MKFFAVAIPVEAVPKISRALQALGYAVSPTTTMSETYGEFPEQWLDLVRPDAVANGDRTGDPA